MCLKPAVYHNEYTKCITLTRKASNIKDHLDDLSISNYLKAICEMLAVSTRWQMDIPLMLKKFCIIQWSRCKQGHLEWVWHEIVHCRETDSNFSTVVVNGIVELVYVVLKTNKWNYVKYYKGMKVLRYSLPDPQIFSPACITKSLWTDQKTMHNLRNYLKTIH